MAKKKAEIEHKLFPLEPAQRAALAARMVDMAFRNPKMEPFIMQLSRVGGLDEVEGELVKMRNYVKRLNKAS